MFLFIWKEAVDVSFPKRDSGTLMIKDWPVLIISSLCKVRLALILF